ncbi:MAG: universal stress protein [Flavobacterium sp.]|nr:universal stress protein [Pedobacter sp.]
MKNLTILIPIDFSPVSRQAFLMADILSQKFTVKIHLLHVIEASESIISGNPDLAEAIDVSAFKKKKEEALIQFNSLNNEGRNLESHIKTGLLTDQIHLAEIEFGADLVIMGTKGADGFMELISGSEAQHVVRYLDVPVITIRPGTPVTEFKNILLVADFEHSGKDIQINLIKNIAETFGSTIHLLQILKEGDERYVDQIQAQMRFFAEQHHIERFEMHLYRDHQITKGVSNFNKEAEMDLVCIKTHGRKGISHLLFGSIAERLVNHCQKPLLTFKLK